MHNECSIDYKASIRKISARLPFKASELQEGCSNFERFHFLWGTYFPINICLFSSPRACNKDFLNAFSVKIMR